MAAKRRRRCKFGVNHNTGGCLKHKRRHKLKGRGRRKRTLRRKTRSKRSCKFFATLMTKNGPRIACFQRKGTKLDPKRKHTGRWIAAAPIMTAGEYHARLRAAKAAAKAAKKGVKTKLLQADPLRVLAEREAAKRAARAGSSSYWGMHL